MRLIASLLLATLVACGARGAAEPAWPKRLDPEVDGGESLAPRTPSVIAAAEAEKDSKTEEKTDATADEAKADDKDSTDADTTSTTPTTTTTTDDVIIIDDIVIEIEED